MSSDLTPPQSHRSSVREDVEHRLTVIDADTDFGGAKSYAWLREVIDAAFNPPDDDGAEEQLYTEAVIAAGEFISAQRCRCTPAMVADLDPCGRCAVLGRLGDRKLDR